MILNIVFYTIWLLNIAFTILKKKSKLLSTTSFLMVAYLYMTSNSTTDYNNYMYIYANSELYSGIIEPGYLILMKFFNLLGVDFNIFYGEIAIICLLIILYVFNKFSDNYQLFYSVFFMYKCFESYNIIRNYIMQAFLLLGIYFLIKSEKGKYLISCGLAFLNHRTAISYLPMVAYNEKKPFSMRFIKYFSLVIALLCVFIFLTGNNFQWLYSLVSSLAGDSMAEKVDYYFTTSTRLGFLLYFVLHLGDILICHTCQKKVINSYERESLQYKLFKFTQFANLYCLVSFPLIMMNMNFYRIYCSIHFLNMINYSVILDSHKGTTRRYYRDLIMIFLLNLCYMLPIVQAANQRGLMLGL